MKPMFFSLQNPISTTFRQLPDALFTCIITINLTTYFPEFLVPASQFKRATFTGNTTGLTKLAGPGPRSMLAFHSTSVASWSHPASWNACWVRSGPVGVHRCSSALEPNEYHRTPEPCCRSTQYVWRHGPGHFRCGHGSEKGEGVGCTRHRWYWRWTIRGVTYSRGDAPGYAIDA